MILDKIAFLFSCAKEFPRKHLKICFFVYVLTLICLLAFASAEIIFAPPGKDSASNLESLKIDDRRLKEISELIKTRDSEFSKIQNANFQNPFD